MAQALTTVLLDIEGCVANVTINRPDLHNAFDETVIAELSGVWDMLGQRDDIRVVVLRGAGKSFSAGADLNWMKCAANYSVAENARDGLALARMLHKFFTLPQATLACIQGAAMGGGMGLASCCDIVLATKEAVFSLSEVKLGLIPATIAPYVLRAIGERHFRRYAQTAERITAEKAMEIGLVHEMYDDTSAMNAACADILSALASNAPQAMKASKMLALDLNGKIINESLVADTASRIAQIRAGDEAKEGLSAFLEKRKASWNT